jgi:diguanylate cyclase (GGDEF)-like protein
MNFHLALLSLEGLSVGDAFGASLTDPHAAEAIPCGRLPEAPWRWTADTHMALSIVDELQERNHIDQDALARRFAWRYSSDPQRGYQASTRSVLEQIAHGEYFRSAVKELDNLASGGAAICARSLPLGAFFTGDPFRAAREARLAAAVTHAHPDSISGAIAVAVAAALAGLPDHPSGEEWLQTIAGFIPDGEVRNGIRQAAQIPAGRINEAAYRLGIGQRYCAADTIPFTLWCAAQSLHNFEAGLWLAVSKPGNRATICAITGGIAAISAGCVPEDWIKLREPLPGGFERLPSARNASSVRSLKESSRKKSISSRTKLSVRTDSLTGLPNLLALLSFLEENHNLAAFSVTVIHVTGLMELNRFQGRTAGDELLRWYADYLQDQTGGQVYRVGGDKFAILFLDADFETHQTLTKEIVQGIQARNAATGIRHSRSALIHFSDAEAAPGHFLACQYMALSEQHFAKQNELLRQFQADEIQAQANYPWMMLDLANQMLRMGIIADETLHLAQTDSVSHLPNMRAAFSELESALYLAQQEHTGFAILLIDGDNLREYNHISYQAGDEAIHNIGKTLRQYLRDMDFLARWRTGDEFLAILPRTPLQEAVQIGERLCNGVRFASHEWFFITTISIGVAVYPDHGRTVDDLLNTAEAALEIAKQTGKDRVIVRSSPHNLNNLVESGSNTQRYPL